MHLILAVFSDSRRREHKGWKRKFVWMAYQLTDWGPAYVIGNLYIETSPRDKMMVAFWVPFLLLHHARPDNISAYAIEDSKLWMRLLVLDIPLSLGSCFIVYRYILAECTAGYFLRRASGIMLPLGIFKYVESVLALWRSDLGRIRDHGLFNEQTYTIDDYRGHLGKPSVLKDDEALLVAHNLFEICKGAFCDYTANIDHDAIINMFSEDTWESMCMVVEMELSLMYDILYTKAAVVHTWHGYAIRLASPPLTAIALLLFGLHCKEDMPTEDEVISYVLLGMTLLLDVRWLFRALASSWTHSYFKCMPHNWLKHEFWCRERWVKLRRFVMSLCLSRLSLWLWTFACPKDPKSYRRSAGTWGQCNLLDLCIVGNKNNLYSIPRLTIESEGHSSLRGFEWKDHSTDVEIPHHVKKLVFSNIWEKLFYDPAQANHEQPSVIDRPSPTGRENRKPNPPGSTGGKQPTTAVKPGWPWDWLWWPWNWKLISRTVHVSGTRQRSNINADADEPPVNPASRERICNDLGNLPPSCPFYHTEPSCNGMDDEPTLWPFYPTEQICNGMDNEPPQLPPYPMEQICNGMDNEPPQLPSYPMEQICNDIGNEPPPFPWYPREWICNGMDNEPSPWLPEHYGQAYLWRNAQNRSSYVQVTPNTNKETAEAMGFPLELQEVILIWHIATDVFLTCRPSIKGKKSEELLKVIKQMSDYMMFLVAKRPQMLPGLTLGSLHEKTRCAVQLIWKEAKHASCAKKEKEAVAKWILENRDDLNEPDSAIWGGARNIKKILNGPTMNMNTIWKGAQLAQMLLTSSSKGGESKITKMVEELASWIPDLHKKLTENNTEGMLEIILDVWVRLLIFASIRCSRDSHAKQLSYGGELTTLVWIITEHTENSVVRRHLKSLLH